MMKALLSIAIAATLATPCMAQDQSKSASTLALRCMRATESPFPNDEGSKICVQTVMAYVDGWSEGSTHGSTQTYLQDTENFESIKGIANLNRRMDTLRPAIACVDEVAYIDVIKSFVDFVRTNPQRGLDRYDKVLAELISHKYCKKIR